jgi:deoxyadenosine/deoxycytidine kinase
MRVDGDDKSIFEHYYTDKQRYGFMFQMYALQSRFNHIIQLQKDHPEKVIICERCHLTDCMVFADMLQKDGIISAIEYSVYKSWYDFITNLIKPKIGGIVYLKVDPEICVQRIIKRNRTGEDAINLEYINKVHQQHESWLVSRDAELLNVCIVDGNGEGCDIVKIAEYINKCLKKV